MQINKAPQSFQSISADALIVGISKNQHNVLGWDQLEFFGHPFEQWIKDGDIKTDAKLINKIPVFEPKANVKRIIFVGLDNRKTLTRMYYVKHLG